MKLQAKMYYVIFYDTSWYNIERILKIAKKCLVKFRRKDLDEFVWPREDEIQEVEKKFIFYWIRNLYFIYQYN